MYMVGLLGSVGQWRLGWRELLVHRKKGWATRFGTDLWGRAAVSGSVGFEPSTFVLRTGESGWRRGVWHKFGKVPSGLEAAWHLRLKVVAGAGLEPAT
jgi:hypothetical protein